MHDRHEEEYRGETSMPSAVTIVGINLCKDLLTNLLFFPGLQIISCLYYCLLTILVANFLPFKDMLYPALHTEITCRKELIKD